MNKIVYIMRGIPGSGKSTVAREITRSYPGQFEGTDPETGVWVPGYVIHSTDFLCMVDGEYQFDIELAGERHEQNFQNFLGSLEKGTPAIIVDNTNVQTKHYAAYVEAAQAAEYAVVFVELAHPDLDVATFRNTHGVSKEIINDMILAWEPSQHNAIVEDVNAAAEVVRRLQAREKFLVWFGFGVGACVSGLVVSLAWILWNASGG